MGTRSIPLIEISGTPLERGRSYGEAARSEIARSIEYYREAFAVSSGLAWADVLTAARQRRPVVLRAAPHLLDEMEVPCAVRQHIATNLVITHRDGIAIDLETTPVGHMWGYPVDGVLAHANHYQYGVPTAIAAGYRPSSVDSLFRLPLLERGLRRVRDAADSEGARKLIVEAPSDHSGYPHSLCAHVEPDVDDVLRSKTTMSSIVDLTMGEYRVARGNPCENSYQTLPWNIYDEG
jgi:isopenicillin-N N-acyltransferase-like protein